MNSIEFIDAQTEASFAGGRVAVLTAIKQLKVGNETVTVGERVSIKATKARNGKVETTVLMFDRSSGLLIGMLRSDRVDGTERPSIMLFDEYRRFPFKNKSTFAFLQSSQVLVPTKWVIAVGQPPEPGSFFVNFVIMQFKCAEIDFDSPIDPAIYAKPAV